MSCYIQTYKHTNIHRSENRFSSKSHPHNSWAHYPKRNPGEKSWVISRTAGCQHRIPKRGIRHCWRHFRQRNLCMGSTPHAVTTLRKDLLTELPQSDKRSVRTHVPTKYVSADINRSHMVGDIFNRRTADIWLISNLLVMHTWLASGFTKNGWYHTSVVAPWYLVTSIKVFGPSELDILIFPSTYIFSPLRFIIQRCLG